MGKVIGIDLGTTNSCVAVIEGGSPVVIPNSEGERTTPSVVAISKEGERLIGQLAKRQTVTNAENTIYSIKRFIGRRWDDTEAERARVPYTCVKGRDGTVDVEVWENTYTPQEISAMVLQKLKADAENFLGEPVTQAVITVPAYFTDAQRQATKDAGTIAGLEVLRIINEPTAAALAYGIDKQERSQQILVFDLGGGTFDVSILQLGDGVFEVKATSGNNHLGGDDFDNILVRWMIERFRSEESIDLGDEKMALQRLREAAENAKIELSSRMNSAINLPFITAFIKAAEDLGPKHLKLDLGRQEFEKQCGDLIRGTLEPVKQALADSDLNPEHIDRILLVGGSTRIPAIGNSIRQYFGGRDPERTINPDEAVALGAAIQGGILSNEIEDLLLLDVTPLSLGLETMGEVFTKIIERNTTIPTSKTQVFSTAVDGQTSVEIHALQGERAMAKDNISLGKFLLTGIPAAPRGVPQIEVSFAIDVNGILKVGALDKGTGREQSIVIKETGGLSAGDIERMRRDAEVYAEEDRRRLEQVTLRNEAENLVYSHDVTLKESGMLIRDALKQEAAQRKTELEAAMSKEDVMTATLKECVENYRQAVLALGVELYQGSSSSSSSSSQGVDREFETIADETVVDTSIGTHELEEMFETVDGTIDEETFSGDGSSGATLAGDGQNVDDSSTLTSDYEAVE